MRTTFRNASFVALLGGAACLVSAGYFTFGDIDDDLDVDLRDFAALQNCFSGSAEASGFRTPSLECIENFDTDFDDDIDLDDAARVPCVAGGPAASAARALGPCSIDFHTCEVQCEDSAGRPFSSGVTLKNFPAHDEPGAELLCALSLLLVPDLCRPDGHFDYCSCSEDD